MSDFSQGDGWWMASDYKWYAPELHPDYVAPPRVAPADAAPADAAPAVDGPLVGGSHPVDGAAEPTYISPTAEAAGNASAGPDDETRYAASQPVIETQPIANPGPNFLPASHPTGGSTGGSGQVNAGQINAGQADTAPYAAHAQPASGTLKPGTLNPGMVPQPDQDGQPATGVTAVGVAQPDGEDASASKRGLLLALGAVVLLAALGFLAFRFIGGGSTAGGAASPEDAVTQMVTSINERDVVGFIDVFDPDEIEAWTDSFSAASDLQESSEAYDVGDLYSSLLDSFELTITSADDGPLTYDVVPLDDDGRISRVRIQSLAAEITAETDQALIIGDVFGQGAIGVSYDEINGGRVELRDTPAGLEALIFIPNEGTAEDFAEDAHLDLVTVQKDGKWYISPGYTVAENVRNAEAFANSPDFGRAFELVESQTGGAASPEAAVQEFMTSIETFDSDTMLRLVDPLATPYLHDYEPLIEDDGEFRRDVIDLGLEIDEVELGVSEWQGNTLVTFEQVSARSPDWSLFFDARTWCVTIEERDDIEETCIKEEMQAEFEREDLDIDINELIPEEVGVVVIERNGRWYLSPLGTMGYYADQTAEGLAQVQSEIDSNTELLNDLSSLLFTQGPIAGEGRLATTQSSSGIVGVAFDLTGFPSVALSESIALGRVTSDEPGAFTNEIQFSEDFDRLTTKATPLTGDDWVVLVDTTLEDAEMPAIGAETDGSVTVELFEPQIIEMDDSGYSGQIDSEGRPQIIEFAGSATLVIDGALMTEVAWWSNSSAYFPGDGTSQIWLPDAVIVWGEPGAQFEITVEQ